MVGAYWKAVAQRALRDAVAKFGFSRETAMMAVLVALSYLGIVFYFSGAAEAWDHAKDQFYIWLAPLAWFPAFYLWHFLRAPAEIHAEQIEDIAHLKGRLTPRFALSLSDQDGFSKQQFGITTGTLTGFMQSVVQSEARLLRLTCENVTSAEIEYCRANLIDAEGIDDAERAIDIGFRESVPLSWHPNVNSPVFDILLASGEKQSIYLLLEAKDGAVLYRDRKDLPLGYHQIFLRQNRFRLYVSVVAADCGPARVCLDVSRDAASGRLTARMSAIADSVASPQWPLGTAPRTQP